MVNENMKQTGFLFLKALRSMGFNLNLSTTCSHGQAKGEGTFWMEKKPTQSDRAGMPITDRTCDAFWSPSAYVLCPATINKLPVIQGIFQRKGLRR